MIRLAARVRLPLGQFYQTTPLITGPGMVTTLPTNPPFGPLPGTGMSGALKMVLLAAGVGGIAWIVMRSKKAAIAAAPSAPAVPPKIPAMTSTRKSVSERRRSRTYRGREQYEVYDPETDLEISAAHFGRPKTDRYYTSKAAAQADADDMTTYHRRSFRVRPISASERRRKPWRRLPAGWTRASLEDFWGSVGGRIGTCIDRIGDRVDDPGAFCASLGRRVGADERRRVRQPRKPRRGLRGQIYVIEERTPSGELKFSGPRVPFMENDSWGLSQYYYSKHPAADNQPGLVDMQTIFDWFRSMGWHVRPKTW